MLKRFVIILILTALLFGGLFGWKFHQIGLAMSQNQLPPPPVVAVTEVQAVEWRPVLTAVGSLTAVAGIDVSSELAGKVKTLHFDSGQFVTLGQPLLDLDTSTDEAELKRLHAEQLLAEVRFGRSEQLIVKHYVSQSEYDLHRAELFQAKADVEAKRTLIAKKRVSAPFTGRLGIRKVNVGQYLAAGAPIVTLQKLDPIYVDFTLPEGKLRELTLGQTLALTVQAYPGRAFAGKISALSPGVDAGTRALNIRATLANTKEELRPGMFADVTIQSDTERRVLTLPDTAISYNPYGDSVFAVEQDKDGAKVVLKQIVTGESRAGRVEIAQGLKAGDKVVSAGQIKLRNGMPVRLDKQPAPGERESGQ